MQDDEYAGAKVVAVLPGSVCHLWLVSREDDQAWISDATCQAVHIETESLEKRELELKGKSELVSVRVLHNVQFRI